MFDLISEFYNKVRERDVDWVAKGFLFRDSTVYTIDSDTKLLGRIFEMVSEPILAEIAEDHGYRLETPSKQNFYPDFILSPAKVNKNRIAVDIKSTYRTYRDNGRVAPFKFTLGSYASFLRNGTKNIEYSYDEYVRHFVIGFLYDRGSESASSHLYTLENIAEAPEPYENVEYFIQEKYKISGFGTGSGNTENIGTISSSSIQDFREGNGPFAAMGNDVFELYWRNYPRYKASSKSYTDFDSFAKWVNANPDVEESVKQRVSRYAAKSRR